jgi:hypothetical protein
VRTRRRHCRWSDAADTRRGAYRGHSEVAKTLAALDAEMQAKADDGITPLHDAVCTTGQVEAVNALVAAGADMQANRRRRSDASARRGAYQGHVEAMEGLAALGADRRAKAADGADPLHDAGRTTERVEAGRMPMALPERGLSRGSTVNPRFKTLLLWSRIGCVALVGGQQPLQRRVGTPHALHGGAAPSAGLPERVAHPHRLYVASPP